MEAEIRYFKKRAIRPLLIESPVPAIISGIITIPAYSEENLLDTLDSLASCQSPEGLFEVVVLVNHGKSAPQSAKDRNRKCVQKARAWAENHDGRNLHFYILEDFDREDKKAGVGTARKILMDEAARRLVSAGETGKPIVGLDADCLVAENYLIEIERFFQMNPGVCACSIDFKHRTDQLCPLQQYAILGYEQHLRHYIAMQRKIGFPFAFQTIGSAMAVRCRDYIRQGGMNRRKAGEDFYFLHKFIELGCFGELNDTCVYPSGRVSDRVPFGTGKAVGHALENGGEVFTYNPQSYHDLKILFDHVEAFWGMDIRSIKHLVGGLPEPVMGFMKEAEYQLNIADIKKHTSSSATFRYRFFRWFNAFRLMKYLHYARDHFYPDVPVGQLNRNGSSS